VQQLLGLQRQLGMDHPPRHLLHQLDQQRLLLLQLLPRQTGELFPQGRNRPQGRLKLLASLALPLLLTGGQPLGMALLKPCCCPWATPCCNPSAWPSCSPCWNP
jgi:hypothetical protein